MSVILIMAAAAGGLGQDAGQTSGIETVEFTIIGEGRGGPRNARYYKVSSAVDADRDGVHDESILKLVCNGGEARHASLQVLPSASARKKANEPLTVVTRWGTPEPALRTAAFRYMIRKSEKAGLASRIGWTEVKLGEASMLCPR